jgi:hypothetical protein
MNHTVLEKKKGSDEAVHRLFFAGFKKNLKQAHGRMASSPYSWYRSGNGSAHLWS